MNPHLLILYFGLVAIFCANTVFSFAITDDQKCKYNKKGGLLKARCYNMDLREVPQFLTTGIEILDLSHNRLKKLKKTSFTRYSNVESLLLYDNLIQTIEPDTFSSLTSLEEIDLSNNGLRTIPLEIFQLPSLRNLYVDSNDMTDLQADLQNLKKPIAAPLEYLNIAECGLQEIPNLGILPRLWHLNATKNSLQFANVMQFAPFCNIKNFDIIENEMPYCACQTIIKYFNYLDIKTDYKIDCDNNNEDMNPAICPDLTNSTIHSTAYQECIQEKQVIKVGSRNFWLFICGGLVAIFFVVLCLVICIRSRKKKCAKRRIEKQRSHEKQLLKCRESPVEL